MQKNNEKLQKSSIKTLIYKSTKRITNKSEQETLINETHKEAHIGIRKTIIKLKQRYNWKNMCKMVKHFINKCDTCCRNKQVKQTKEPFRKTSTPSNSFEVLQVDTVGSLRISNGNRYILTMQCELTKYIVAEPIPSKDAKTIAKVLIEQVILKYGHFKTLKSDNGTEFTNELINNICKTLNIKQIFSTPYHHETLGSVERNHRVMNEFFLTSTSDHEWDKWIPYYTFAYNTTPHVDTGYSPFELVYGKLASIPSEYEETKFYDYNNYAVELKTRLKFSLERAQKLIDKQKQVRTEKNRTTNPLNLKLGDLVLLKVNNRNKLQSPYKGPYRIVERQGVNSLIQLDNKNKLIHNNQLKPYLK